MSDGEIIPALYEHCCRAYKAMLAESHAVVAPTPSGSADYEDPSVDPDEDTTAMHIIVYEGFLTQLITQELRLSVPYYTSVRKALINMGCVRQLKRGGGTSPSQWEMIKEPSEDAFRRQRPPRKVKQDRYAALEDQIRTFGSRINDLEDTIDELVGAWAREFGTKEVK